DKERLAPWTSPPPARQPEPLLSRRARWGGRPVTRRTRGEAGGAEGGHRARERSGGAGGPGERGGAGHGAAEAAEITSTPPARCGAGRTGAARRAPARPRTATGAPCPDQRLRCGSAGLVLPPSQRLQVCPACRDAGPPRGGAAGASAPSVRRRPPAS
ncbi:unnamed protein product, partial [Prorocentrum cordatum]